MVRFDGGRIDGDGRFGAEWRWPGGYRERQPRRSLPPEVRVQQFYGSDTSAGQVCRIVLGCHMAPAVRWYKVLYHNHSVGDEAIQRWRRLGQPEEHNLAVGPRVSSRERQVEKYGNVLQQSGQQQGAAEFGFRYRDRLGGENPSLGDEECDGDAIVRSLRPSVNNSTVRHGGGVAECMQCQMRTVSR